MVAVMKRALICAPGMPEFDRQSGERRLFHSVEFLREDGWAVSFVAERPTNEDRYVRALQQLGVETYEGVGPAVDTLLTTGGFDVAILAFWHTAERFLPLIRQASPRTRIIVDSVDLHFLRVARGVLRPNPSSGLPGTLEDTHASEFVRELNIYAHADAVMGVSNKDAGLIADFIGNGDSVFVVPDNEELALSPFDITQRQGILFVGNFWHRPNLDAAEFLCKEIIPRLASDMLREHPVSIVGNKLEAHVHTLSKGTDHVRMVGWVPSTVPYVERARVNAVPLLYGSGTKRKLLQALMLGTPSVSTHIGIEGLGLHHGENVLVADDPASFAASVERLLQDADLWTHLAQKGREYAEAEHGRTQARSRLRTVIANVLEKPPKPLIVAAAPPLQASRSSELDYKDLVARVRTIVNDTLPPGCAVAVVSKGDPSLLDLAGRPATHFPRLASGEYAGYYPGDSPEAIRNLEAARASGVDFIVFPWTSLWWLEHYVQFREHLDHRYVRYAAHEGTCIVYDLRNGNRETAVARSPASASGLVANGHAPLAGGTTTVAPPRSRAPQRPVLAGGPTIDPCDETLAKLNVLALGVYLADEPNFVDDIVDVLGSTSLVNLTQRWARIGSRPPTPGVADVTVRTCAKTPKFVILNMLIDEVCLDDYDYLLFLDDDILLPQGFLDSYLLLQQRFGFSLAQPARTPESYIDHPIVTQQYGVAARQTLFVEIGPVFSIHRSIYDLILPFDTSNPMGWGYENVWSQTLSDQGRTQGIIDATPVDHSLRKPVQHYDWAESDQDRRSFLRKRKHRTLSDCFTVLHAYTT